MLISQPFEESPRSEESLRLNLAAVPAAPSQARQFARKELRTRLVPPQEVQAAETVISELVTNAVHASGATLDRAPGTDRAERQNIGLTLRLLPGEVVVEVTDDNPAPPVLAIAAPDSESGRGLLLVDALSKAWGHSPSPSGGKVVFAVLGITSG